MKSKITKIQIFKKGIAILMTTMLLVTPIANATTSLDDSYLEGSFWEQILYGEIGSTAKEIEEWFNSGKTTLYITNETQLRALAEYVNNGNSCSDKKIILLNDIEVDSVKEWIPIGNGDNPFEGIFDGKGYTISGINFNRGDKLYSEITDVGLFGATVNATIKNITIVNSKFDVPYDISSDILDTSNDLIEELVEKYKYLGAIAGRSSYSTIENCNVDSTVDLSGLTYVGGIVGYSWSCNIIDCSNKAFVKGYSNVGGIAGGFSCNINGMSTEGINYAKESYRIGKAISCINEGEIHATFANVGGIMGAMSRDVIVQKCKNEGIITSSTETFEIGINGRIEEITPENIGGIVGCVTGDYEESKKGYSAVDSCINNGKVEGYRDVGGIAGQLGALNGGYSIFTNNINYSTDIKATYGGSEAGYLAGEVGGYGNDKTAGTEDDPHIYMANNFYVLTETYLENLELRSELGELEINGESKNDVTREDMEKISVIDDINHLGGAGFVAGYGSLTSYTSENGKIEYCYTEGSNIEDNNSASIIYYDGSNYYVIYKAKEEWEIEVNKLRDLDVSIYKLVSADGTNSGTLTIGEDLTVNLSNENAFVIDGNKWAINNESDAWTSDTEYIINANTGTKVKYSIYKNNTAINGGTYFKEGDTIKVTATFNKYLAQTYGPLSKITTAPTLKLNNSIEMDAGTVNATTSTYTTTIDYTYTVTSEDNLEITSLDLSKSGTMYAISGNDYSTNHPSISSINKSTEIEGLIIDTTAPIINTKVYVENMLETERYTAGKEIIIETTTTESIQATDAPRIQVSFSESGIGKYNYDKENGVGYAKCIDAKINLNGTTTWTYSYQIQEGDEGSLQLKYDSRNITDLAGNITDLGVYSQHVQDNNEENAFTDLTSSIIGNNAADNTSETKNITYSLYKGAGESKVRINGPTYIKNTDEITIEVKIPGFVYTAYQNGSSGNSATLLDKTKAPILKIDGKEAEVKDVTHNKVISSNIQQQDYSDTITTITYQIKGEEFGYDDITKLNSIEIEPKQTIYLSNRYVKKFADNGASTEELYDVGEFNKVVTKIGTSSTSTVDISNLNIYIDSIGIAETFDSNNIYSDTTAPTVQITTDKTNPTNAELITYTFKFSEVVEGFTVDDITVNNGDKVTEVIGTGDEEKEVVKFTEVTRGLEYTLEVMPITTAGNEGTLQVIVENGVCQDLVAKGNIRQENTIAIDKIVPTVEVTADKGYVNAGETITYTFTWSEDVKDFTTDDIAVNNGTKGTFSGEGNSYTLEVVAVNGNDVDVSIEADKCTDIAGNSNIASSRHLISVAPTVIIETDVTNPTNKGEITYTFEWSEEVTGFDISDIILPNGITGNLVAVDGTNNYAMTIDYSSIIPSGNEGEVTVAVKEKAVQDSNGNENAYTTNTLKIDRIAPIFISLEAYATSNISVDTEVDTVKEYYKAGDTVTIVATFTENIEGPTAPALALQFSESGNAKNTVSPGEIKGNKITYTYEIKSGDAGILSVKGFSGVVTDNAGNEVKVTKRTLDGDTIIADTIAPELVGITAIAPDFEYDELLLDDETKRYGELSETRENNTITIIAEYSENIYNLTSNTVSKITDSIAPVLKLKFGIGTTRTAEFSRIEGNKVYYTYNIASSNDNGNLAIVSLVGKINDIAGNTYETTTSSTLPTMAKYETSIVEENKVDVIIADTTKASISLTTSAINYDDNGNIITGNSYYYRKGAVITITASTNEYVYKFADKSLERFTVDNAPTLNVSFATSGTGVGTCTNVEYKDNKTIFTYTYTVKANDNGQLNLSIAKDVGYDIALNGNSVASQSKSIYADTVNPLTNWQSWVESEGYGIEDLGNGDWKVTFSETLYTYNPNTHTVESKLTTSNKSSAPILLVSKDNSTALETSISGISTVNGKTVITYTYADYTKNIGPYGMKFANVSDKAGNIFNYRDITAPTLSSIKVTSPGSGTYKAGELVTIVATFSEELNEDSTAPALALQFADSGDAKGKVIAGVIEGKTITYTYTIVNGDNGRLSIKSFSGTGLTDLYDNEWVAPETVTLSGNTITADTIVPTVIITSDVENTNKDIVTYTFTWSEKVVEFTIDDIEVTNGSKGDFKLVDTAGKVYTLTVDTTGEGRQTVKVAAKVCTDIAGNLNAERVTYNKVVMDYTKPVIRAKVNGGSYVIDTDSKKSTLKETIVVNEELSKFEYVWSKSQTMPETGWMEEDVTDILVNSDINLNKEVEIAAEEETYYLYIKATDLAGNTLTTKTKGFVVSNSKITLTADITEITKQDVTVTVAYGEGLTENRKAGVSGKTQSADSSKVIINENGTVYAEATDKASNKVYVTLEVSNIDKVAPEATIEYTTNENGSVTATISFNEKNVTITNNSSKDTYTFTENGEFTFEFKDAAGNIGTIVAEVDSIVPKDTIAPTIIFDYTLTTTTIGNSIGATIITGENAIISYSWDNKNWTTSEDYITSVNAADAPTKVGTYTLYAKAIDNAGNESKVQTLEFTVVEEPKQPDIIFEDLTTLQIDGVKYVKISSDLTVENLTEKMNNAALCGETPEYTNLTEENKLKTGSEISMDGTVKYIVVVRGDVNCDGKVTFSDIIKANAIRISSKESNLSRAQLIASDINNTNRIEFRDIISINAIRLNSHN